MAIEFRALNEDGTRRFAEAPNAKEWREYNEETSAFETITVDAHTINNWLIQAERAVVFLEDVVVSIQPYGRVIAMDTVMGTTFQDRWSQEQIAAVVRLALLGDEVPDAKALYEIAEPLFADWPIGCRLIP